MLLPLCLCLVVLQVLQDKQSYYLVMEHCSGERHQQADRQATGWQVLLQHLEADVIISSCTACYSPSHTCMPSTIRPSYQRPSDSRTIMLRQH